MARPPGITKDEILQQALALFLQNGIAKTEMKQIAGACAISRMTLYRYYDSKESIAFQLAQDILQAQFTCMAANTTGATGYQQVENALRAMVQMMQQDPGRIRLLDDFDCYFADQYPESPMARQYTAFLQANRSQLKPAIALGVRDGSIRPDADPDFDGQLASNVLMGVAQRVLPRQAILYSEQGYGAEYLDATLTLLLQGLKAQT